MSVTIKSPQEIELMREAGKILAKVHEQLGKELKPGMSTLEVDRLGEEMIRSFGCEPSFKGYQGYPASICVSINEEVVHGIPRADRIRTLLDCSSMADSFCRAISCFVPCKRVAQLV